ncbi:YlxR family protein [Psychromicrobium silvestre]|uniref:YlxR family protein n=1 Tax=Psychromicrobium silvestre TaxID=1645614 RepID=UPI001FEA6907|nr:YlxR family protein [Psychromicrobium silvestre]
MRTCVGCRRRDIQPNLLRVVRTSIGSLETDPQRRLAGRGAWLHPKKDCLELALKRRGFARTFRGPVDTGPIEKQLTEAIARHELIQPESGSEN